MELLNDTPFIGVPVPGRLNFPGHSLTLVVKGTFDLSADTRAIAAEEQLFPTGDEYYPDDEEMRGGPSYASDFAYFKPRADMLLVGSCHAPGGTPVMRCPVVFQVGDRRSELVVSGNRTWHRVEAEPFVRMPLRYENSFGGTGHAANPVGKGIDLVTAPDGRQTVLLPNIESSDALIRTPDQRPPPAGFAPLNQTWAERHSKLGRYDGDYLEKRWPWFAEDVDWGYFNAAPPRMQLDGYLQGDEPLYFENLHPEHAQFRAALPGLRLRCFVSRLETEVEPGGFREVPMRLDTLWVDTDTLKLVLVWRGPTKVTSPEPEEIEHFFVASENLAAPAQPVEHYRVLFERRVAEQQREGEIELVEPEADAEQPAPTNAAGVEQEIAKAEKEARARLLAAGIDPDNLPPPDPDAAEKEAQTLKTLGFEAGTPPAEAAATRAALEARAAAGDVLAGQDFSNLDLSGLTLRGVDLRGANFTRSALPAGKLSGANLSGANLAGVDLQNSDLSNADLSDADLSGSRLSGANLTGAKLVGASFEGADLIGATLTGADAQEALFAGADLTEARARGAVFNGADFSTGILSKADLRGCALREASLEGAVGHRIDLSGADLFELRAGGGDFSHGLFIQAKGADSSWAEATLSGADFRYADLEGADFTGALMNAADLLAANMKFARLPTARLSDARLMQANLFQASLEKADLTGANLSGSNLYGSETLDAKLVATKLEGANVKMTKLAKRA